VPFSRKECGAFGTGPPRERDRRVGRGFPWPLPSAYGSTRGRESRATRMPRTHGGSGETLSVEKKTFTKRDRIRDKLDFDRLRKSGTKCTDGVFLVVILPNGRGFCRLGIAVPKRVGNAVARNRIKRLIREVFRLNRSALPDSVDLLVVMRRMPDLLTLGEFSTRILSLLDRYRAGRGKEGSATDGPRT
jgi:ribonuclease P protein component